MPKQTVELEFGIGDPVLVREVQRPGKVDFIQIDRTGSAYRVSYWDNGKRESVWLDADEIQPR